MTSTTVDALKNLYVALGGTVSDVANMTVIPDVINAIAELDFFSNIGSIEKITSVLSVEDNKLTVNASKGITMTSANNINISSTGSGPNGSIYINNGTSSVLVRPTESYIHCGTNGVNLYESGKIQIDTIGNLELSAGGKATLNNKTIATTT